MGSLARPNSFNTQPPEGGWRLVNKSRDIVVKFQHTAARRRLVEERFRRFDGVVVSTHSRPKAAGAKIQQLEVAVKVSTHSRPKAAGSTFSWFRCSTSFQHTAARRRLAWRSECPGRCGCFNTQPPEGGWRI